MNDQQPVMAAIDSVATSTPTIVFAAQRAHQLDRPLTLIHLVPTHHRVGHGQSESLEPSGEHAAHRILQEAAAVAATVIPMDRITTRLDSGHPAPTLAAASMHAHELVIGDGYGVGGGGVLTADVVATLATDAPVPLTVVPADWTPGHDHHRRVVAGIGRTDRIPPTAIQHAFDLARDNHASLEFLHVWDMGGHRGKTFEALPEFPGLQWNSNEQIRTSIDASAPSHDDVPFEVSTYWGRPTEVLRAHATGAALLVLAREHHHRPRRGRVSRPLIRHAPCPVHILPVSWGEGGLLPSSGEQPTFAATA